MISLHHTAQIRNTEKSRERPHIRSTKLLSVLTSDIQALFSVTLQRSWVVIADESSVDRLAYFMPRGARAESSSESRYL